MLIPAKVLLLDDFHPPEFRNSLHAGLVIARSNKSDLCALCRTEISTTADEVTPCVFGTDYDGLICPQCLAVIAPALSELLPLEVH